MSTAANEKKDRFVLTDFIGNKAVTPSGDPISIGTEWDKLEIIAFYFSAHWCPPCRKFTPHLSAAYKEYKEKNLDDKFELVFVSSDSDEKSFKKYHRGMTFPALDYTESRAIKEALSEKFNVNGIPYLAVMDAKTGEPLYVEEGEMAWAMSPRDMITHYGSLAFPLSKETSTQCLDIGNQKQQTALQQLSTLRNVLLPPESHEQTDTYTFATLLNAYQCVGLMLGSKGCLEALPLIGEVIDETNKDENGTLCKKLALIYVPDCFTEWDAYVDKPYKEENVNALFHFQEPPSQDVIDSLKSMAGQVTYDTLVITQQTSKQVDECGMNGKCASKTIKEVTLVATDSFASKVTQHGAKFFPWNKDQVEQAEKEEKAFAEETRVKMEASVESFLVELALEGKLVIGSDTASSQGVSDRLKALDDEEGLIGFYFGPRPTNLVECFEKVNESLTKNGKKQLEVVYAREHSDGATFQEKYGKMVTDGTKTHFMAIDFPNKLLSRAVRSAFAADPSDPPYLVLMKKDGTVVSTDDETAKHIEDTGHWGFPWNEEGIAKGLEKIKELTKQEDDRVEKMQKEMGVPVVRRLIGIGRKVRHNPEERVIRPSDGARFITYGMQDAVVTADTESNYNGCSDVGLLYYEVEVIKLGEWAGAAQVGFCAPGALDELIAEPPRGHGCGDTKGSWGVCGLRRELWNGRSSEWPDASKWKEGDVVGLAVNTREGKIAVAINGAAFSVVFQDEEIKSKGVFPCFSIDEGIELRYNTTRDTFKYSGPAAEVWLQTLPTKDEEPESEEKRGD